MIARLAAFLLLAAGLAAPAFAQTGDEAIVRLIRGSYATYIGADAAPRPDIPLTPRLRAAETECAALQKKIDAREGADTSFGNCSEDYDLLCQCQDPFGVDWSRITVAISHPAADRAEAVVRFPAPEGGAADDDPDIRWVFARTGTGWAVDDFWEYLFAREGGEGSYRKRLVEGIQAMRRQLGMPAWQEPAR